MVAPIFTLSPGWDAQEIFSSDTVNENLLGDGYTVNGPASLHPSAVEWDISRKGLTRSQIDEITGQLSAFGGVTGFLWSPLPGEIPNRLYFVEKWNLTPLGPDTYEISMRLVEDVRGSCVAYAALIDEEEITNQINQASSFLTAFSSTSGNYLVNSSSNLVLRSLHTHSEQIPSDCGTLYDQITLALACLNVYDLTGGSIWLTRATNYAQSIIDHYYNSSPSDGSIYLPHWLFDVKSNNRREDIYPISRTLNTKEVNTPLAWLPMLWELYDRLYQITNNTQWQTLATSTKEDAITSSTFTIQNYVYRKNSGSVTEYPGTQIEGSGTRVTSGTFNQYVNVSGSSTLMVENTGVYSAIAPNTTYTAEVGANTSNRIVEIFVSTTTDDTSDNFIYRQFWRLGTGGFTNTRVFASHEFFRWENLTWFYGIGLVSGTANYEENEIEYEGEAFSNVVLRLNANAELVINKSDRNPFKIFCKGTGIYRIKDINGYFWDYTLSLDEWTLVEPTWANFAWSGINTIAQGTITPSTNGNIQSLQIITSSAFYIWWIGSTAPELIPAPSLVYRVGIRDRNTGTRNLYVGDVYPTNSPTDVLINTPGVVPFARNITSGIAGGLTGLPYSGYQNVLGWSRWNEEDKLENTIEFLKASQNKYANTTGDTGPFAPLFTWNDMLNLSQGGVIGEFGFEGFDELDTSGFYQAQIGLWLAKAWYENTSNEDLKNLAMSWIKWLDQVYSTREDILPPVLFTGEGTATGGYDPGVQALIGEAALWCNLAGGDPAPTFRWIYRSLLLLESQKAPSGNPMTGSWSLGQAAFATTLKEYYSWWHSSVLNFYSSLLKNKDNLIYPPCSEPITIATSEPFPEICCGATIPTIINNLPFAIVLIVDASGSLSPEEVPSVFEALTLIRNNLVALGNFTSTEQADLFIFVKTQEEDERYLRWYVDFSLETGKQKVVIINFQDEADSAYHGLGGINSEIDYDTDLASFSIFMSNTEVELLGAKIFVPGVPAPVGSGGSSPDNQEGFLDADSDIDTHLEYVFNTPSAGGYPLPVLNSFQNSYETNVLEYEFLIPRDTFTTTYVYNKMATYLNTYLNLLDFSLLPIL